MDLMDSTGNQVAPGSIWSSLLGDQGVVPTSLWPRDFQRGMESADLFRCQAIPQPWWELARTGLGVHLIRNGHSFIKEECADEFRRQYLAASEESAHYYMKFPLGTSMTGARDSRDGEYVVLYVADGAHVGHSTEALRTDDRATEPSPSHPRMALLLQCRAGTDGACTCRRGARYGRPWSHLDQTDG